MSLAEKITEDLKQAMKDRDELRLSCLRMLKAAVKNKQVEKGRSLKDEEIQSVISSYIRKNEEAAKEYRKGGREELADKEEKESKILYDYLPKQLGSAELEQILRDTISELSAEGIKDLGKVMKTAMTRIAGKAQGGEVNKIAKKLLS
jgi:hypothetical protein